MSDHASDSPPGSNTPSPADLSAGASRDPDCVFCRIVSGAIPATLIAHSDVAVAFADLAPQAPVHALVIPRRHVPSLASATDSAELGHVMRLAAQVADQLGLGAAGYRVVTNVGADGGQSVPHLHFHVLGGRAMRWPPG